MAASPSRGQAMIHYSVIVPHRSAVAAFGELLPRLCRVMDRLVLPYEVLCIDDGSTPSAAEALSNMQLAHPALRVLQFDAPRGTSATLTAGIAASRGDLCIAIDPQTPLAVERIPHLIARIPPFDLVLGCRQRPTSHILRSNCHQLARLLKTESQISGDEDLFFAARREAVAGLSLAPGAFRVLSALVLARGRRVGRLTLCEATPPRETEIRVTRLGQLTAEWINRRFEPHLARELFPAPVSPLPAGVARGELPAPRYVPQAAPISTDKSP